MGVHFDQQFLNIPSCFVSCLHRLPFLIKWISIENEVAPLKSEVNRKSLNLRNSHRLMILLRKYFLEENR